MNETIRKILYQVVLPVIAPLIVGLGSAVITTQVMVSKLDTRVSHVEIQIERHEKALDRDFARHEASVADIAHRTEDQEKRLTRLEALFTETQTMLQEIRSDVKILLRGGQQ